MRWSTVAAVVLCLPAASCGSSPAKGTDAGIDLGGVDLGVDGTGPDGTTTGDTVQINGSVHNIRNTRIAGARVCIVDHPEIACATADASGNYTLTMPAWTTEVDIAFNVTAAGYLGFTGLVHEMPGSVTWLSAELYDDASATTLMNQAGFTYPAGGKAFVQLSVLKDSGGSAEGVSVSSSPAGAGPVYFDKNGKADLTLTAVTTNPYLLFGALAPGSIEITVSDAACMPVGLATDAWVSAKPNSIAGKTAPDSMTTMTVRCQF
jgi:hypothetical protein